MLSLPRVPIAKEVPREVKPDQFLAHFVTIGWLLDGVRRAGSRSRDRLTPANVDDGRAAALVPCRRTNRCKPHDDVRRDLATPLVLRPAAGPADRRARADAGRCASRPPTSPLLGTLPVPAHHDGRERPRRGAAGAVPDREQRARPYGRICARTRIMRAAQAAGARVTGRARLTPRYSTRRAGRRPRRFGEPRRELAAAPAPPGVRPAEQGACAPARSSRRSAGSGGLRGRAR